MKGSADVDDRNRALESIVALATQHGLSASEIAAALGGPSDQAPENRWRGVLVRVLGFLGGTFVFAGIGVFIALQWDAMNSASRVLVTLGAGFVAFVLALLAARDARFDKASTPLLLVAAALEPTGMFVAFDEVRQRRRLAVGESDHVWHDGLAVRRGVRLAAPIDAALHGDPVRDAVLVDGA